LPFPLRNHRNLPSVEPRLPNFRLTAFKPLDGIDTLWLVAVG
jgi:hypothetical protein